MGPSVVLLPMWLKPPVKIRLKSERLTIKTKLKAQVCMYTSVKDGEKKVGYRKNSMKRRSYI